MEEIKLSNNQFIEDSDLLKHILRQSLTKDNLLC